MDTVLVTGGTGHLGTDLVWRLKGSYRVRVLARSPGSDPDVEWIRGDLATGAGIAEAVAGSQTVIHAATLSPAAHRGYFVPKDLWSSPSSVDRDGTARLLEQAGIAGVAHLIYVSIVARAAQFHWLVDRMFGKMARLPMVPLPDMGVEPVDTTDFADYLVESIGKGPSGRLADFGGPEVLTFAQAFDQWQDVRKHPVRTMRVPLPSAARDAVTAMSVTGPGSRRGKITWADWLRSHPPE
jgi:uncharacterized protein YbjT (DUF2867 family)